MNMLRMTCFGLILGFLIMQQSENVYAANRTKAISLNSKIAPSSISKAIAPKSSWPFSTGGIVLGPAVVGDLDGNGLPEIVFGSNGAPGVPSLFMLNAYGQQVWNFPNGWGYLYHSPTLSDLDRNGKIEILFGDDYGKLFCLNYDHSSCWSSPYFQADNRIIDAPMAVDLDQDKIKEIIFSTTTSLYCLNANGSVLWRQPLIEGTGRTSASILDIDYDGFADIVMRINSQIVCLNHRGEKKWTFDLQDNISRSGAPVVADLEQDGLMEVIFTGGLSGQPYIFCLDNEGKEKWRYAVGMGVPFAVAVGDLDHDGYLEVVSSGDKVYFLRFDGSEYRSPVNIPNLNSTMMPVIGDIDRDGELEIIITNSTVHCLDHLGNVRWETPWVHNMITSSPVIADLNGNGTLEMLYGSYDNYGLFRINCLDYTGQTCRYNSVTPQSERYLWPISQHDIQHTSNYNLRQR